MVRAGKVSHPRDWRWCAYDELTGKRRRYRIVDQERLLHLAAFSSADEFFRYHADSVDERLHAGENSREPCWTEGVAVGNEEFVEEAEAGVTYRQAMHRYRLEDQDGDAVWVVREAPGTYMPNSAPESSL